MSKGVIIIEKQYISRNNGLCRLNTQINENGETKILYAEVEEEYGKYLCIERADGVLYLILPVALRENYDIYSEVPITGIFLHNLNEILIPHLALGDKNIHSIKIYADVEDNLIGGGSVGTAISCGVDSMYTVKQYTDNKYPNLQLTDLFIASVNAELWDTKDADLHQWVKEHQTQFSRYEIVAKELNLRLIKMYTNYFWYICGRDWKIYHHLFTHNYITMASVLALKKLWRIYFFASATPYTIFDLKNNSKQDTDRHELLSNHVLSTPDFLCFSGGIKADRIQKTYELADYPLAQKVLHPCHKKGMKNCSEPTCDKCLRGLLVFDYYGKLDNMKEVFDVNRYKRDRKHYLWQLVAKKDNEFFTELYKMFCEKYPEEMRSVRESYEKFISPVPARDFRVLQKWYNFTLQLMLLPQPTEVVKNFFKSKGINKLYCTGGTNIGNRIKQIISDDIKCVNYINSKVSECDAAMILDTIDSEISKKKDILSKQGAKKIYTLYDLELLVKTLLKDVH